MFCHYNITEIRNNITTAAEGIAAEIPLNEMRSELDALKRYEENLKRMSSLIQSYKELLEEDAERIYQAAQSLLDFDRDLLSLVGILTGKGV